MADLHPIVAILDDLTRDRDTTGVRIAAALDVSPRTVYAWRKGRVCPSHRQAVAWAAFIGTHLAALDGTRVVAVGSDTGRLARLRRAQKLTQEQVGQRRHVSRFAVSALERVDQPRLSTVYAHLPALGLRLHVIEVAS